MLPSEDLLLTHDRARDLHNSHTIQLLLWEPADKNIKVIKPGSFALSSGPHCFFWGVTALFPIVGKQNEISTKAKVVKSWKKTS
jgi:hypothetical protein